MNAIQQLIEERLKKSLEEATKEEVVRLLEEINEEKFQLKKQKRYGLVWEEQVEEVEEFLKQNYPLLTEVKEMEIIANSNKPMNLLIEGDNLHALNTLIYTHREKVDVIYIDPPYNTGNKDFCYNDRYVDKEDTWRHSKWLSFMEKRLKLAKELLRETGVILISIDDNEYAQLKLLCDQIFNEKNFESFIWKKKGGAGNTERILGTLTEYVLCYFKNKQPGIFNYKVLEREYKYKDDIGHYNLSGIEKTNEGVYKRTTMLFGITNPSDGETYYPKEGMRWTIGEAKAEEMVQQGKLFFDKKKKKVYSIKRPQDYEESSLVYYNLLDDHGSLLLAKGEMEKILGGREVFDTPKPLKLIKHLLGISTKSNSIILDFFAGSGTTGHAVLELNQEDGGTRQFILVTNNENNICEEVTYERLKRVINGYTTPKGKKVEGLGGNLKYYRTDFVSKQTYSEDLKLQLAEKSHELLSIKENCFFPHKETNRYKILANHEKAMAIYTDSFRLSTFHELQEELLSLPQPQKLLYILSLDEGEELSYELQQLVELGIQVKPIPRKIKELFDQALR